MRISVIPTETGLWTGVTADLVGLVPVLAAAFAVVLGAVALVTGWQLWSVICPAFFGPREFG